MADPLAISLHARIGEIGSAEWDALYSAEPEAWAYLAAIEEAVIPGFELFYVAVRRRGRLVAAAPGFITVYRIDTTAKGVTRRLTEVLHRVAPALVSLKLASLGSPVTETAAIGVAADALDPMALIAALYEGLKQRAAAAGVGLMGVKDIPAAFANAALAAGKARMSPMASLPTAVLDLAGLRDLDGYLAQLSPATRKDLRRKLKKADIAVERVRSLTPHAATIERLYASTRARAAMQFEELGWRYFQGVLDRLGDDAALFLYRSGGEVIGFSLLIGSGGVWVDKYFCTDERGPLHDLYFVSWIETVKFVLASGGHRLIAGQTAYETKLRLGCRLEPTTIFFRHRSAPLNALLFIASRFLAVRQSDPSLRPTRPPAPRAGTAPRAGPFLASPVSAIMAALRRKLAPERERLGVAVIRPAHFMGCLDPRTRRTATAEGREDALSGASTQAT